MGVDGRGECGCSGFPRNQLGEQGLLRACSVPSQSETFPLSLHSSRWRSLPGEKALRVLSQCRSSRAGAACQSVLVWTEGDNPSLRVKREKTSRNKNAGRAQGRGRPWDDGEMGRGFLEGCLSLSPLSSFSPLPPRPPPSSSREGGLFGRAGGIRSRSFLSSSANRAPQLADPAQRRNRFTGPASPLFTFPIRKLLLKQ